MIRYTTSKDISCMHQATLKLASSLPAEETLVPLGLQVGKWEEPQSQLQVPQAVTQPLFPPPPPGEYRETVLECTLPALQSRN